MSFVSCLDYDHSYEVCFCVTSDGSSERGASRNPFRVCSCVGGGGRNSGRTGFKKQEAPTSMSLHYFVMHKVVVQKVRRVYQYAISPFNVQVNARYHAK